MVPAGGVVLNCHNGGFIGHLIHSAGLVKAYPNELADFVSANGAYRQFVFPILFAAFWQEPVFRGFLFKAFRGSYSVPISILLEIGYITYGNWSHYRHFGLAAITVTPLTIVLCCLREKSASLWDCILCHLVFNLTGLFLAGVLLH